MSKKENLHIYERVWRGLSSSIQIDIEGLETCKDILNDFFKTLDADTKTGMLDIPSEGYQLTSKFDVLGESIEKLEADIHSLIDTFEHIQKSSNRG